MPMLRNQRLFRDKDIITQPSEWPVYRVPCSSSQSRTKHRRPRRPREATPLTTSLRASEIIISDTTPHSQTLHGSVDPAIVLLAINITRITVYSTRRRCESYIIRNSSWRTGCVNAAHAPANTTQHYPLEICLKVDELVSW